MLKDGELLILGGIVRLGEAAEEDLDRFKLLFRDDEHPDRSVVRKIPADARPVLFHGVDPAADAGVNRVLDHEVTVLQQGRPESGGSLALRPRMDGQIIKDQDPHELIHGRAPSAP